MDFALSSQQQLLIHTARGFLRQHCPPERVQSLALEPNGFADDLWKAMAALGWPGLLIPHDQGGSGGSMLDVVALVEEMGRACLPGPYIPSAVVATSILLGAPGAGRASTLLTAMAVGDRICAVAVLEESARYAPEAITMDGETPGRLNGHKLFVKDAHAASDVLVIARRGTGLTALLLPMARAGITAIPLDAMGDDKLFELSFSDVDVSDEDRLAVGEDAIAGAIGLGALARSAEMVGAAARILDLCVEYAQVRVQSGRPIGAFQAIQHQCADLLRDVEASRWLVYDAAWRVAALGSDPVSARSLGSDPASLGSDPVRGASLRSDPMVAVATAKAFCGEACLRVARRAQQIMGAIGYCEEHPLHLLHKRIMAAGLDWGDPALHLETVARSIGLA